MQPQRLADLAADGQHRIEDVIGSWKIIEMSLPRIVAHLALGQRQQIAALEADRAGDPARRLRDQPQDRQRR